MKKSYAFILSGAMAISTALVGCTSDTTTGVETETTGNEVDAMPNNETGGTVTEESISPQDTSNNQGTGGGNVGGSTSASTTGTSTGGTTGGTTSGTTAGGTTSAPQ